MEPLIKLLFSILLGLLTLITPVSAQDTLPLDYFTKHNDYINVKLSPDGRFLAARARNEGQIVLVFIRRDDMQVVGGVRPREEGDIQSVRWVNDERVIYTMSRRYGFLDFPVSTGELYAVNRDGKKHEIIFGYRADDGRTGSRLKRRGNTYGGHQVLNILPDDERHILIAEYPWRAIGGYWRSDGSTIVDINMLDIYTGRMREVESLPIPGASALADDQGRVRFAVGVDQASDLQVAYKPIGSNDWQRFSLDQQGLEEPYPFALNQEGTVAYLSAISDEQPMRVIYALDLGSQELRSLVDDADADIRRVEVGLRSEVPVVGVSYPDRHRYHYLADDGNATVKLHKMLAEAFPGKEINITSSTRAGDELILHVSSAVDPGEFYLFNSETLKAEFLLAANSWVDPRQLRPVEPFRMEARDGTPLHGYVTLPGERANGPYPTVVLVHGGPYGVRDSWSYDSEVQLLAHHGYAVVQVNFRGSGGYGDDFLTAGYREWGGAMQNDVTDATRWAIEQGYAREDGTCIYGGSYGGYAALMGVVTEPELYQCAIGMAGVYDLPMQYEKGDIPLLRSGPGYLEKVLGDDPAELHQRSPAHRAAEIQVPVMLAHGGEDERVPLDHARTMKKALEDAGKTVEWLVLEDEGHGFYEVEHRNQFYRAMLDFLAANLRSGDGA